MPRTPAHATSRKRYLGGGGGACVFAPLRYDVVIVFSCFCSGPLGIRQIEMFPGVSAAFRAHGRSGVVFPCCQTNEPMNVT